MHLTDSGAEIILDSGHETDVPKTDHEYYYKETYGMTAEEAIIAHYEDFHLFMYGLIPLAIAITVIIVCCIWFEKTFTRY